MKRKRSSSSSSSSTKQHTNDAYWVRLLSAATNPTVIKMLKNINKHRLPDSKMTRSVDGWRNKYPERMVLVKVGSFYNAFGVHALVLAEYAGLRLQGKERPKLIAGCPAESVDRTLVSLTHHGLETVVVEETRADRRPDRIVGPCTPVGGGEGRLICLLWESSLVTIDLVARQATVTDNMDQKAMLTTVDTIHPPPYKVYCSTEYAKLKGSITISKMHARCPKTAVDHIIRTRYNLCGRVEVTKARSTCHRSPLTRSLTDQLVIHDRKDSHVPSLSSIVVGRAPKLAKKFIIDWVLANVDAVLRQCMESVVRDMCANILQVPDMENKLLSPSSVVGCLRRQDLDKMPEVRTMLTKVLPTHTHDGLLRVAARHKEYDTNVHRTLATRLSGDLARLIGKPLITPECKHKAVVELVERFASGLFMERFKAPLEEHVSTIVKAVDNAGRSTVYDAVHETIVFENGDELQKQEGYLTVTSALSRYTFKLEAVQSTRSTPNKKKRARYGSRTYTTSEITKATVGFVLFCHDALREQKELLREWCAKLSPQDIETVRVSATADIAMVAVYKHVWHTTRNGWSVAKVGTSDKVDKVMVLAKGLFAYFMNAKSSKKSDITIDRQSTTIVTAPNGSGKSTVLRSLCVSTILACAGLMVPCDSFKLSSHLDAVLLRLPAMDRPAQNLSSFQCECVDLSAIMARTTPKTLVIMDEIGRSTSYNEAVAFHEAVVGGVRRRGGAIVAATHLYELLDTIDHCQRLTMKEYVVSTGECRSSLALEVCSASGMPPDVVDDMAARLRKEEKGEEEEEVERDNYEACVEVAKKVVGGGQEPTHIDPGKALPLSLAACEAITYLWEEASGSVYVGETMDPEQRRYTHTHTAGNGRGELRGCAFVCNDKTASRFNESKIIRECVKNGLNVSSVCDY